MPSPSKPSHQEPRPLYGIGLKVLSVMIFVGMQTCLKAVGDDVPAGQLVFFRSFFALIPVVIYLWWLGDLGTALATDDIGGHFIRGIVGVTSMGLGFFALSRLPYPEWISLSYGAPLLTVVFAAIFLKEVVRAYRWVAVLVGLCGIVIVAAPNFSLSSGDMAAIAMIQVRRLVAHEKTATIVVYFSMTCSIIALVTLPFGWVVPDGRQAVLLVGAGLCGGVGQLLLTACYRYADTSTIAPFEYTSMIAAVVIGYTVFNEEVTATTLLGAFIVISAGLFIIFREHRLGLERRRARKVSPPSP